MVSIVNLFSGVLNLVSGYKTYVAAVGLVGLAVYQLTQGQYDTAMQSVLAALAAAGLRHAVTKQPA